MIVGSAALKALLTQHRPEALGGVSVADAEIDAAWFSRPPTPGGVPWEIRYLGNLPFALVENIDENSPDFEARLRAVERRLTAVITAKTQA